MSKIAPHAGFDEFWTAFPKKKSKIYARKAWDTHRPDLQKVLDALAWQCREWAKDDPKYIPYPASWLNAGRWDDEPVRYVEPEPAPTYSEMKARGWTH